MTLVRLVGELDGTRLRQFVLHDVDLAEDLQRVGVGRVVDDAHVTVLQHVVDVADILAHLQVGVLQQQDVLLQVGVRLRNLGDVAARTEDGEEFSLVVAYGHQLQFVVHL